ncbi:isoaspartyl peptidase/L-asparaginase [Roseofilum casamattae]|uniref:Isoaspartyl peptidase/L-asparaginase n=1 Tax=Roseofilum casamattae BLCC-M143 TaxID=3022442 RepID=A0ABT7BY54_9CYAN|nr:isoaspartyl peptidase/L-asparaginase [Roseofilum casamattae]MDJ1184105.1 isoaspartyl peptidase/L-asparaginase [Roseofilum casamattae BLCC-M143]
MTSGTHTPKLIIHGGAGSSLQGQGGIAAVRESLYDILKQVYAGLEAGIPALEAVIQGCRLLEDDPRYNAGTGSVLQSDGQIRMSASLMNGETQTFSGVINVSRVKNPVELAQVLQEKSDRVLSDLGAIELVRELQVPTHNPLTDLRLNEWLQDRKDNFKRSMANVVSTPAGTGTIGVVVLDNQGKIAAGTSTGGKGFEYIGRVSDSAMPAGNYATSDAGISCTGIGEDIINECIAARIVVRVTDGMSLADAFAKTMTESKANQRDLGAIGIDKTGQIAWGKTSEILLAAYHTGEKLGDTLEWTGDEVSGSI